MHRTTIDDSVKGKSSRCVRS